MPSTLNEAFMRFTRRAEVVDRERLVETFVDAGPLMTLLSSLDHQVLFGRRGTGKTHALSYLTEQRVADGDAAVYVDLRRIGSTGGIYADPNVPLTERGTRLLIDTLAEIHDGLMDHMLSADLNLQTIGPILDELGDAITEIAVVGSIERETENAREEELEEQRNLGATLGPTPGLQAGSGRTRREGRVQRNRETESGVARHRVHFGRVGAVLGRLGRELDPHRLWVVLDEWSSVPLDLQPLLGDLLRRALLPTQGITLKLGAIEQRTRFRIPLDAGDYLGLEVGADITADVNLDDFMVFDNDPGRAKHFFGDLLHKHYLAVVDDQDEEEDRPATREQLLQAAFTQVTALDEFIRAAEGVPRDAINIIGMCAQRALDDPISVNHVRAAAKTWYQRDKEAAVNANPDAHALLHWVIDEVIGERRARAFLLRSDSGHDLIDLLFDARVLHILKKSISAHDQPGIRYNVYKLDYGCYVDLISTARAPQGLLQLDTEPGAGDESDPGFVEVPPDDYRSIRRAILRLDRFEAAQTD